MLGLIRTVQVWHRTFKCIQVENYLKFLLLLFFVNSEDNSLYITNYHKIFTQISTCSIKVSHPKKIIKLKYFIFFCKAKEAFYRIQREQLICFCFSGRLLNAIFNNNNEKKLCSNNVLTMFSTLKSCNFFEFAFGFGSCNHRLLKYTLV